MCPEVLRGEGCGPPGDAWALGVVLFQLLALRVPFKLMLTSQQAPAAGSQHL